MESISRFCGIPANETYTVWDYSSDTFGQCFLWTSVSCGSHAVFLITCAYLHGIIKSINRQYAKSCWCIIHVVLTMLLALLNIVEVILSYVLKQNHPPAYVLSKSLAFTTWILCFWLQAKILVISNKKKRIVKTNLMFFLLILISSIMESHFTIEHIRKMKDLDLSSMPLAFYGNLIYLFLSSLFLILSIIILCSERKYVTGNRSIPSLNGNTSVQVIENEDYLNEKTSLLSSSVENSTDSYVEYQNKKKQHKYLYLGKAENTKNILSRITFWWGNKLVLKGYYEQLQKPDDLFILPNYLNTAALRERFSSIMKSQRHKSLLKELKTGSINEYYTPKKKKKKYPLLQNLNSAYGTYFFSLGILKLMVDLLGFTQPLLLNRLVSFMENKNEPISHGYYYALGLLGSTLLQILLLSQFQYNVMNFMSTDTDRVTNFCRSFHQFWSLPFQIAVSLYLLYRQVGEAFLAGVGFMIILVLLNKYLAVKITQVSKKTMKQKDERVKIVSEILNGIRIIKLYAWENCFIQKVNKARLLELKYLKWKKYLDALCVYFWAATPVVIACLTFTTYVLLGNELTAAKVFTSVALFNMLIAPLNAFPWVLNGVIEAWVSLKRIQEYVSLPDINLNNYYINLPQEEEDQVVLEVERGSFHWKDKDYADIEVKEKQETVNTNGNISHSKQYDFLKQFRLNDINFSIEKGQLIGITGKVGSGKSSLFASIIAETEKDGGHVYIGEEFVGFGLVAQESWVQHMTIKENILFGKEFDPERYEQVIHACALNEDLDILPAGDATEVGENGVTLSGGQKARLALARAVYQDKEIYLLDDPLAAVDVHVAAHIFKHCIMGILRDKTRLLSTHHTKYLWQADYVMLMKEGIIEAYGPPNEVLVNYNLIERHDSRHSQTEGHNIEGEDEVLADKKAGEIVKDNDTSREFSVVDTVTEKDENNTTEEEKDDGKFIEEEKKEKGQISRGVVKIYWKAVGTLLATSVLLFLFLAQASRNASDWWLAYWISDSQSYNNQTIYYQWRASSSKENEKHDHVNFYLMVYGIIGAGNTVMTFFRAFLFAYGGIKAAKVLHNKLLQAMMDAPIPFFDKTPVGRIVNRFSSDVYAVDDSLPFMLNIVLGTSVSVLGTVVMTCYGIPWFTCVLVPLAAVYYSAQRYYRKTSRELKRLCTITRSPIYEHFSETLAGLMTIRAFRETHRFTAENEKKLDCNQRALYSSTVAALWLMIRLNTIAVLMITSVSFLAVVEHQYSTVNPGLVGLAISYALSITYKLSGLVNVFTETEKQLISVERLNQSIKDTPKEDLGTNLNDDFELLSVKGRITFDNVYLKYRPELPFALQGVTFTVKAGEKIGICGRTGSGKSSIMRLIFKIVCVNNGRILIDDTNIQNLHVKRLRSKMSIIPQDPFLFDDTIEINLDPERLYTTFELYDVLEKCHLIRVVQQLGGLQGRVGERGNKLSAGQKQLMCLARALLKKAKVICIDEATASVDMETDKLVQKTIREEFGSSTVLTIAHRVETIMDSDRVLVMDSGRVSEFDPPALLLNNEESLFYALVKENERIKK